jgi:hypothetical protein
VKAEANRRRWSSWSRRRRAGAALVAALLTAVVVAVPAGARPSAGAAQATNPWQHVPGTPPETKNGHKAQIKAKKLRAYTLDRGRAAAALAAAPAESAGAGGAMLSLPAPDGSLQRFALQRTSLMEPALAARHPEISTFGGRGIDDPTATVRADLTPLGFHASVRSAEGNWYVDPYYERDESLYVSYYTRDAESNETFVERDDDAEAAVEAAKEAAIPLGPAVQLRTYRLALVTDPSYTAYFGGPANVTAAKVTLMNRVNQIYEDETAIRMVLVASNDLLNFDTLEDATGANGPCGAAPCFTVANLSSCTGAALNRNRIVVGQLIGASNYDIGHLALGNPGGGVAGLNVVGGDGKARGCTGLPTPVGDFFAVDYVSHEMGHQFGGNHTFNGNQWNCSGGNRNGPNSVEPGSGSSIMAYAGICRHDNLQPHSDPYWSQRSYQEITTYVGSTRNPINEVQTVSLRDFDGADSFRLSFGGNDTAPIVRGANYTTAGIKAALESMPGWPAGGTVTVAAWGGTGALNDTGFQVTFTGTLAQQNQGSLALADTAGATGFVGETAKGGPIDNNGHTVVATGNHAPVVTTPPSFVIPTRTPFALTGSATDSDGDTLAYMWEQNDRGATGIALVNNVKTSGPLFRQFGTAALVTPEGTLQTPSPGLNAVGTDPTRVFPDLAQVLANNTNAVTGACNPFAGVWPEPVPLADVDCYSEFLPTADWVGFANDRTLNFRLTVRDLHSGGGGIGSSDTRLTIEPAAGPFLVTSQATAESLPAGSGQAVTWDVAGTNAPPIATDDVKISLSLDGGWTYPVVLAESTPNDGSESLLLPNVDTATARIKVEAVGNVYFDVSATDFTVRGAARQLAELAAFAAGAGPGTSLESKARAAGASLERGTTAAACNQLVALQNEVDAQTGASLTTEEAAELTQRIGWIRTALGC